MEFDVFISHSSKDKTMADAVCAKLEQAGIRCWIAPRDIQPGMTWSGEIMKAIDKCRVMVLVFSANANESVQIVREVESAVHRGKPILPLRIEDIQPSDSMAFFMNSVHWLDAISEPHERYLDQLVQAVGALLGKAPEPKRVPPAPVRPKPLPAGFDLKTIGYGIAIAVVVLLAVLAGFWLKSSDKSTGAGTTNSGQVINANPSPVSPSVVPVAVTPAPANTVSPASPNANPPAGAAPVDNGLTGTWTLKTHVFDYDGVVTLSYAEDRTYQMDTVLSDSGTYQSGAGQFTTTSNGSGFVRQGTYVYAGNHTLKVTGPLGLAFYSPAMPQAPLDPVNPVMLGTWVATTHPPNSPPWKMTLTNRADGTYSFEIDVVDSGTYTASNGHYVMRSHVVGTTVPGAYQAVGQDSMEITGTLGTMTWTRKQP